jgi:hypothetical protein
VFCAPRDNGLPETNISRAGPEPWLKREREIKEDQIRHGPASEIFPAMARCLRRCRLTDSADFGGYWDALIFPDKEGRAKVLVRRFLRTSASDDRQSLGRTNPFSSPSTKGSVQIACPFEVPLELKRARAVKDITQRCYFFVYRVYVICNGFGCGGGKKNCTLRGIRPQRKTIKSYSVGECYRSPFDQGKSNQPNHISR